MNSSLYHRHIVVLFTIAFLMLLSGGTAPAYAADRMTYAQAQGRIPNRDLPAFWLGGIKGLAGRFEQLTHGAVSVIAISPGGRPMHLIAYGPNERGEGGSRPSPFNLTSALYHVSGARPFTFECPHGIRGNCQVTLEQILDIQLTLYEAMLQHELDKKK